MQNLEFAEELSQKVKENNDGICLKQFKRVN